MHLRRVIILNALYRLLSRKIAYSHKLFGFASAMRIRTDPKIIFENLKKQI